MAESKGAMVEQYRRDTIQCAAPRVIARRRLEETGRPPEEDVEWIVDLLLNGLSSRSRA
jgi:hypothetical protein